MKIKQTTALSSLFRYLFIIILVVAFIMYIGWQARFLIAGPQVWLTEEPDPTQTSRILTLAGGTQNITTISVNGRSIVTDETGYFRESIILENGYTIVNITATDRYGRETTIERPYVFVPKTLLQ